MTFILSSTLFLFSLIYILINYPRLLLQLSSSHNFVSLFVLLFSHFILFAKVSKLLLQ